MKESRKKMEPFDENKLIMLKKGVNSSEDINLLYDADTGVEYWQSKNGLEVRLNSDGSCYNKNYPNVFKDVLPYIIIGGITLIILIIMANIFQVLGQQYNAVIMWLLFFVVAAFVSYRILKTIEKDIKSLPDKVKAAWKADIWGGYALLFNLIGFLLYLAHYVNWDEDIKFIINLLK